MNKRKNGRKKWFFVPVLMTIPVAAGLIYTYIVYSKTIKDLLLAACKVVMVR